MKPKKRQKICSNCDGEIDLDVIVCPYCAADLREEKPEQQRPVFNTSATSQNQKTMESLYPSSLSAQESIPSEPSQIAAEAATDGKAKNIFGPTILFTLGVQLCLFGLLMVL